MQIRQGRVEDARGVANVQIKTWKTTYKGIVPDEYMYAMKLYDREQVFKRGLNIQGQNSIFYVAEEEETGKIVGFISGGKSRHLENYPNYDGELYAVYLLEEYQGNGIGGKLILSLLNWMKEKNFKSILVWVLTENKTIDFYEYYGAKYLDQTVLELAGEKIDESLYVWEDIQEKSITRKS